MKIRTLLKLAAIGGVAYAHKKRGGTWTLASFKESANALLDTAMKFVGTPGQLGAKGQQAMGDRTERTGTYGDTKSRFDDNLH